MKHTMKTTVLAIAASASLLLLVPTVHGKTASPAASPTSSTLDSKIEDLKVRLATKVAELRKTSPKAISGTISSVSISSITVDTTTKSMKIDLADSIKVFQILKGKRTALSTDDVDKNDQVTIFGDHDSTLDVLKANIIFIEAAKQPQRIHGFITEINKKDNSISMKGLDGTVYTVDIETTTKTLSFTMADGIEKSGFSKMETGMFVSVFGLPDSKTPNYFSAVRILHMDAKPQATLTISPTISPTTPSTPSATPLKKSPTVKPKPTATPTP
jgi:hypothetical protein